MLLQRNAKCQIFQKKNLITIKSIIAWKRNHLFMKNYFRKKKIMVGENRWLPASTDIPVYCIICGKYRKLKNLTIYIFEKTILSIICSKCKNKDKKYSKEKNQLRYNWKFLVEKFNWKYKITFKIWLKKT